mmetsp:Transcript_895/g.730  ORF Transcript_895/g.730 Transcript_895/m.730 type:complete len:99 (-) Transcript_895:36-332(-)
MSTSSSQSHASSLSQLPTTTTTYSMISNGRFGSSAQSIPRPSRSQSTPHVISSSSTSNGQSYANSQDVYRPFLCTHCGKRFKKFGAVVRHLTTKGRCT